MAISRLDQSELLLSLHAGSGAMPFGMFLERLRRRLGADRVLLVEKFSSGRLTVRASDHADESLDWLTDTLERTRPGRVYTLAELRPDAPVFARLVRSAGVTADRWLVALAAQDVFLAADSVLLSALADHVAIACDNQDRLAALRVERSAMQAALDRGGIEWALLDRRATWLAGSGGDWPATERAALTAAIAEGKAIATAGTAVAMPVPPVASEGDGFALALRRTEVAAIDRAAAFATAFAIPASEARFAVTLAEHGSLADAAAALGITLETARFYSKRLYAATGTRGQAELMSLFWRSIAALA